MTDKVLAFKNYLIERKSLYLLAARVIIAAGLIALIIFEVDFNEIVTAAGNALPVPLFLCLLLMPLNLYLQFLKWKLAAKTMLGVNSKKKIYQSLFYGIAAGAFTPARLGEYWGRSVILNEKAFLHTAAATLVEKSFALLIVICAGAAAAFIFTLHQTNTLNSFSLYISAATFLIIIAIPLFAGRMKYTQLISLSKKLSFVQKNIEVFKSLKSWDKISIIKMFLYSGIYYLCCIVQYALLALAFTGNTDFLILLWAGILVMFSKTVLGGMSFGDLGIREGASVFFLTALGGSSPAGFNTAIFLFMFNTILPSLLGLYFMFKGQNGK